MRHTSSARPSLASITLTRRASRKREWLAFRDFKLAAAINYLMICLMRSVLILPYRPAGFYCQSSGCYVGITCWAGMRFTVPADACQTSYSPLGCAVRVFPLLHSNCIHFPLLHSNYIHLMSYDRFHLAQGVSRSLIVRLKSESTDQVFDVYLQKVITSKLKNFRLMDYCVKV